MLQLILLGSALAQSPVQAIQQHLDSDPVPGMVFSCSPTEDLVKILQAFPMDSDPWSYGNPEARKHMTKLLEPGALEAAGLDTGKGLLIASGPETDKGKGDEDVFISVGFNGDATKANDLLQYLVDDITSGEGASAWMFDDGKGAITLEDGMLTARKPGAPSSLARHPELLEGLPTQEGCALYMNFGVLASAKNKLKRMPLKPDGMSVFIPTRGGAAHLRVATDLQLKTNMAGAEFTHNFGSSLKKPSNVIVMTVDPIQLMGEVADKLPPVPILMPVKKALQNTDEIPIQVAPGMVVAMFDNGQEEIMAAVMPIHTKKGRPVPAGRLTKGLTQLLDGFKAPYEKSGRNQLMLDAGKTKLHLVTKRGLVFISNSEEIVREASSGKGTPWVNDELRVIATQSAIAAQAHLPPKQAMPALDLQVGLSLTDGMFELHGNVDMPEVEDKTLAGMVAAVMKMQPELSDRLNKELFGGSQADELKENLETLAVSQMGYHAEWNKFHEAGPWPRAVEDLNEEETAWAPAENTDKRKKVDTTAHASFNALGWLPKEELTAATYWVEVGEDGTECIVWGAIDADGDGEPAKYKVVMKSGEKPSDPQQVTAEGVR